MALALRPDKDVPMPGGGVNLCGDRGGGVHGRGDGEDDAAAVTVKGDADTGASYIGGRRRSWGRARLGARPPG